MSVESFPAAVVKELRDRANRYRLRCRDLERALACRELADEARRANVVIDITDAMLASVSVDRECRVHGAVAAIATPKP